MLVTVEVNTRSYGVKMRPDMSTGDIPLYCQATATTGTSMFGKMSIGVRSAARAPMIAIIAAITMNVYGFESAMRTSAIMMSPKG
jgi:hypothetical protein